MYLLDLTTFDPYHLGLALYRPLSDSCLLHKYRHNHLQVQAIQYRFQGHSKQDHLHPRDDKSR